MANKYSRESHQGLVGLTNSSSDLLPGTLELLILKALVSGTKHGYGIVEHLRLASDDVLRVGESALYPALQRLLLNGWVKAKWGTSENNRLAGLVLGSAGGLWAARFVAPLLFQVETRDPATFVGAAGVLAAVSVLAAWLPARRAARLDPVTVPREG